MKWSIKPEPKKGDIRIVRRFLWIPCIVGLEHRWLEWATLKQEFEGWDYSNMDCYKFQLWITKQFIYNKTAYETEKNDSCS